MLWIVSKDKDNYKYSGIWQADPTAKFRQK